MEYSSLEEAFPRPEHKKKSKKSKQDTSDPRHVPLSFVEETADPDPDRPFCNRMSVVDAFQDISTNLVDMPRVIKTNNVRERNFQPSEVPKYFGKGTEDEEGFSNYTHVIGNDSVYTSQKDFANQFLGEGLNKAQGGQQPSLPALSVVDKWKPLTESGVTTASFHQLPEPPEPHPYADMIANARRDVNPSNEFTFLQKRIDYLYRRMAELEAQRGSSNPHSQTEILLFVGTGLGFILALHGLFRGR
jgi:hypothetical protein